MHRTKRIPGAMVFSKQPEAKKLFLSLHLNSSASNKLSELSLTQTYRFLELSDRSLCSISMLYVCFTRVITL